MRLRFAEGVNISPTVRLPCLLVPKHRFGNLKRSERLLSSTDNRSFKPLIKDFGFDKAADIVKTLSALATNRRVIRSGWVHFVAFQRWGIMSTAFTWKRSIRRRGSNVATLCASLRGSFSNTCNISNVTCRSSTELAFDNSGCSTRNDQYEELL
jgi:hypothetical protein